MIESHCDVAIVTALRVEREAVVRRLEAVEPVRDEGEPLTYYVGTLPGKTRPWRVVVTELLDMGNPDAAIATTKIIRRWRPACILMVGIAGGVRGKVNLGDVALSEYAHYYEPCKVVEPEVEHRGRQYNSDPLLYSRARDFEAAEWKGQIEVARPDLPPGSVGVPQALFGPIACGEAVVASTAEMEKLRNQCPRMIAVAMEGAGVAKAVASHGKAPRYLEIRGISDYAGPDKNDGWREYAAAAAAAFSIGFLRSGILDEILALDEPSGAGRERETLVVAVQSLQRISAEEILPALRQSGDLRRPQFLSLDFTDLVQNKALADPEAAASRLCDPRGLLAGALANQADASWAFQGLASIPLVVLAGFVVSDRRPVRLFDYHPEPESWMWPGTPAGYPELTSKGLPDVPVSAVEITLRVSVSYHVSHDQIDGTELGRMPRVDLAVPSPVRSIVRSEEQTRDYGRAFRRTLDALVQRAPRCEKVHLFYAGPMSLAFNMGQQISETMHPKVIAWNYSRTYEWGIDLSDAVSNRPCLVRSREASGGIS